MEHLALEVFDLPTAENPNPTGSQFAVLPDDTTITVTVTSQVFASGDVWSWEFQLNAEANAHLFGSAADLRGSRLHDQIDHRRARLWMEEVPAYLGYLKLGSEAEVDKDGNISVSIESGKKTFDQLIDGAKASQVPLLGDVPIGVALWRKRWVEHSVKMHVSPKFSDSSIVGVSRDVYKDSRYELNVISFAADGQNDNSPTQDYPQMVFPKGLFYNPQTGTVDSIDCLNTDYAYSEAANGTPSHPYCNIALSYQRYGYERKNEKDELRPDYSQEPEAQRGYEYMPANRVNSAPCFYVLYWLRCLMNHLGIHIEENQMLAVEDLRRLFFVNTRCYHREPKKVRVSDSSQLEPWVKRYKLTSVRRLVPEQFVPLKGDGTYAGPSSLIKPEECKFNKVTLTSVGTPTHTPAFTPDAIPELTGLTVDVWEAQPWTEQRKSTYETENSYFYEALATPECFPDVDVAEVISALENGFGMRLLFDDNYQRVRIVLLRNIFRSQDVQHIQCEIIGEDVKVENNIRGFRMTYGKGKDDSHFYYKGLNDLLPHKKELWVDTSDKHDYSQWDVQAEYGDIINKVSAFNKVCYICPETGNAHIIKVDKGAKRYWDLHQSLYETAGFMDAEDGNCTGEDETIHEISVGFTPAIMNDLNMDSEREGNQQQRFALFVDAAMRPRRPDLKDGTDYDDPTAHYDVDGKLYAKSGGSYVFGDMMGGDGVVKPGEFSTVSDMYATKNLLYAKVLANNVPGTIYDGHGSRRGTGWVQWPVTFSIEGCINEGYRLYLQDNYEPNDDGVSPIETHDWGLTLGIMRGSGSDAYIDYKGDPDDDEGNDTWDVVPGSSATAHHDTCDNYGNRWDYTPDANSPAAEPYDGRISLKLRAEKPNPYYDPTEPTSGTVINTKAAAAQAMTSTFTTANCDLLNRPKVPNATMRAAGWNCPGDGYATVYSMGYGVRYSDGTVHEILWSPIKPNGTVLTQGELTAYVGSFDGLAANLIVSHDTNHLILDIDTNNSRAELLHELQAIYYAEAGEQVAPVIVNTNSRYLDIEGTGLQRRGIIDQFYPEYSKWMREARIVKRPVRMEVAQLLAIDTTKKVQVGDITGLVRKMQFTVSKTTGLGNTVMEIMYI